MNTILLIIFSILCIAALFLKDKIEKAENKYFNLLLIAIFILGFFIRFYKFWHMPMGINQDEASVGYDAWAEIKFGQDRNGYFNPVYSVAWGSGHTGFLLTLLRFSFLIGDLNVFWLRLPMVLLNCISLIFIYKTSKLFLSKSSSLIFLLVFAINPYLIMISRWSLDCNALPSVLIIAGYFLTYAIKNKSTLHYCLGAFFSGLCLYAYGTAVILVPITLIFFVSYALITKAIKLKQLLLSVLVFILTAVPIGVFLIIQQFNLSPIVLPFISFPKLISARYNSSLVLSDMWNNFATSIKIIINQTDPYPANAIPGFGFIYKFALPFVALGIIKFRKHIFMSSLLLANIIFLFILKDSNINRLNAFVTCIVYFSAVGVVEVYNRIKYIKIPLIACFLTAFCMFSNSYFGTAQQGIGNSFQSGIIDAIKYASELSADEIHLDIETNSPYIQALFALKIDPKEFEQTVKYLNPNIESRKVEHFYATLPNGKTTKICESRMNTKSNVYIIPDGSAIVIRKEKAEKFGIEGEEFGFFVVSVINSESV